MQGAEILWILFPWYKIDQQAIQMQLILLCLLMVKVGMSEQIE